MAARIKHTAIIRSLNTKNGDHGGGARLMHLGRRDEPTVKYPDLGAVLARELGRADSQVPDYVTFYTATEGRGSAIGQSGFLGARYDAMVLTEQNTPPNLRRLDEITELDHQERADLRDLLGPASPAAAQSASLASHNEAYARVRGLMASEKLFDISQEPQAMRDQYGPTLFGEQALIARRLVEAGVPFVRVARAWWDSHGQNFETHLELVPELDHVMAALIDDLGGRGLLEHTLIVTLAEFGRTPQINASLGRDHFASAWSMSLTGCGIKGGAVYGKSDEDGHTGEGRQGRRGRALRHDLPGPRHRPPEGLPRRQPPDPADRSGHETDPGGAGVTMPTDDSTSKLAQASTAARKFSSAWPACRIPAASSARRVGRQGLRRRCRSPRSPSSRRSKAMARSSPASRWPARCSSPAATTAS